ncbi:hypothetical protein [Nocardia brasiliensis]|uniref:hypothetical protein n=1 Tax=Nocardia brasiliensis TaxID=37326 RepID=UPI0033E252A8
MPVPTETEIRDGAKQLGLADENGNYPRYMRNRIAKAVQLAKCEAVDAEDPHTGTTAEVLGRFAAELHGTDRFTPETTSAVVVEVARWLLETRGLQLETTREETTP